MPYFTYNTGTTPSTSCEYVTISATQMQQQYEEYVRERERKDQEWARYMMEEQQRMDEERQEQERIAEDKRRHPLFYWRELCSKQRKEGIV